MPLMLCEFHAAGPRALGRQPEAELKIL